MRLIYQPKGAALEYAPWAANLYVGCVHGCKYCYVPGIFHQTRGSFAHLPGPRGGDADVVMREFKKQADAQARSGDERPILLSFTTDPYQPCERTHRLTAKALAALAERGLRGIILTKSICVPDLDLAQMAFDGHVFGMTLTGPCARAWEPGASLHHLRLGLLGHAKRFARARTWASIEPVIYPEDSLAAIYQTHTFVDHFSIGKLNHMAPPEHIHWPKFREEARDLLVRLGFREIGMEEAWEKPAGTFYIKRDLKDAR